MSVAIFLKTASAMGDLQIFPVEIHKIQRKTLECTVGCEKIIYIYIKYILEHIFLVCMLIVVTNYCCHEEKKSPIFPYHKCCVTITQLYF